MLKTYIKEKKSWLLLLLSLQLLIILFAIIDPTIPITSAFYIVTIALVTIVIFFFIRYPKETTFLKALSEQREQLEPRTAFQESIYAAWQNKAILYEQTLSKQHLQIEEEKDQILSWIHEVKTPLTVMKLMIDRIEEQSIKQSLTYEWLRIHLLLDQQLHQNRMDTIENDLFIETVDLSAILTAEIKPLIAWCRQKEIGFELDLNIKQVISDSKWLAVLLRQLITNAVKYSENNTIMIKSIHTNDMTQVIISDSGKGIANKDIPRIFDKGFTSTTEHDNNASTGMGLYLVKRILPHLKMTIEVNSTLHVGTTFTLTFPNKNAFLNITSM
ncbi:two-component system, OmpR family, bacitracin resistance sensor histidine kinase BceS [Amphibacillus marinus]|uniref:histidine kinase n=1 Tax=Amphibacillus marinus TaxID=872970 RepID=A0A1H8QHR4_9BACI|nr:sensor histidine kinase [Amphibacillus marinus]SEO53454.1 two-component system, OmpR family, bacitracin resistance sensor histidine kinase BceS [Amphibacillus marinus]